MTESILQGRKIVFIGAGPMAEAVVRGLVESNAVTGEQITVTNRSNRARLDELHNLYGVQTVSGLFDHPEVIKEADVLVLAVHPHDILPMITELRPYVSQQAILSVAAGVTTEEMEEAAQGHGEVVRVMPNTACGVLASATLVCYGQTSTAAGQAMAKAIFSTLGTVTELAEADMDGVTAITGCGPAYVFALVEALQQSTIKLGVSLDQAREMVRQTLVGAAKLMEVTGLDASELRKQVTSPNGVTMAALEVFERADLGGLVDKVVHRAIERTQEITDDLRKAQGK